MVLLHARPAAPARHSRGLARALVRGRFRAVGLVPAVLLGLGGGAGTALAAAEARPAVAPLAVGAPARDGTALTARGGQRAAAERAAGAALTAAVVPLTGAGAGTGAPFVDPLDGAVPPAGVVAAPVPLDVSAEDRMAGLLSMDVPTSASGVLVVVPGSVPAPDPAAPAKTVRVEVEQGLPVDGERFARLVMGILNAPGGWGADGSVSFARTDGADPDLRVVLASPDTVDEMCAPLDTEGEYSCGRYGHAAINYLRWATGAGAFPDMTTYRQYVVNHEVGHLLGHPHEQCPGPGQTAPVMVQQTISVASCVPNGWPFPDRA